MKLKKETILNLNFTLHSSETIMFTKGGKHEIDITRELSEIKETEWNKVCVTFQMERNQQGQFDHITLGAREKVENDFSAGKPLC